MTRWDTRKCSLGAECAEFNVLESALAEASTGQAGVVLIEGAPGCGKTELINATVERAFAEGAVVLRGAGMLAERDVPLGVLHQLLACVPANQVAKSLLLPWASDPQPVTPSGFYSLVQELSLQFPVICCVDDLHDVDNASLRYLQLLIRHARKGRILVVVALSPNSNAQEAATGSELLRGAGIKRISLGLLDRDAVNDALRSYLDVADVPEHAEDFHALVGGNPMLLSALLEEMRDVERSRVGAEELAARPGGAFARAVITCIRRSGLAAYDVSTALATLGEFDSPERAAQLLGLPSRAVAEAIATLNAAGILKGHRFGHPVLARLVLDGMDPVVQARLHGRYAELLHAAGDSPATVAWHLMASHIADGEPRFNTPWAVDILRERAEQLLAEDDPQEAARYLEVAQEACSDIGRRAEIKVRLATVSWRFNPSVAEMHLSMPLQLGRSGQLTHGRMGLLARLLGAQGRIAEAREVSRRTAELEYSGVVNFIPLRYKHAVFWRPPDQIETDPSDRERFLETTVLTEHTLLPIVETLQSAILSDQLDQATTWCQRLSERAQLRDAPGWVAVFAALHGEALLRSGDLRGAEELGLRAREALPEGSAAFAGATQSLLIRARTAMGKHAVVARMLDEPALELLYDTVYLPSYLHSRGQHFMALGQTSTALYDFLEAGRIAAEWEMDRPLVLPWRTDAAEALLKLGEPKPASRLVKEQLAMPDARHPRIQGISLRMRAAMADPQHRQTLLEQAAEELRRCGDRLQLARAIADLGRSLQAFGETSRASMLNRQAWHLAHACGAEGLQEEIFPGLAAQSRTRSTAPRQTQCQDNEVKVSESERRVATLAAQGYTNREISSRLYITVSTVEQHLTRIYRKLNIRGRRNLPADLQLAGQRPRCQAPAGPVQDRQEDVPSSVELRWRPCDHQAAVTVAV